MPFRSKAQQRWMFATHPEMAKEWAEETDDFSKLPERVRKRKKRKRRRAPREKVALARIRAVLAALRAAQ